MQKSQMFIKYCRINFCQEKMNLLKKKNSNFRWQKELLFYIKLMNLKYLLLAELALYLLNFDYAYAIFNNKFIWI